MPALHPLLIDFIWEMIKEGPADLHAIQARAVDTPQYQPARVHINRSLDIWVEGSKWWKRPYTGMMSLYSFLSVPSLPTAIHAPHPAQSLPMHETVAPADTLLNPRADGTADTPSTAGMSEKARGKQRRVSPGYVEDDAMDAGEDHVGEEGEKLDDGSGKMQVDDKGNKGPADDDDEEADEDEDDKDGDDDGSNGGRRPSKKRKRRNADAAAIAGKAGSGKKARFASPVAPEPTLAWAEAAGEVSRTFLSCSATGANMSRSAALCARGGITPFAT